MNYGDFTELTRKTASEKYCMIKHLSPKYDGYQRGLAKMVYNFFCKNIWQPY